MPLSIYNRDIPDGPNNPSVDQPKMKTNTNSIDNLIGVDHFSFNDANGGLHKQVNMITEASPPLLGNLVLYTKIAGGQSTLWAKNSTLDLPLFTGKALAGANGYSSIYGGFLIQWGFVNGTHGSNNVFNDGDSGTVIFNAANINFPNNVFTIWTQLFFNSNTAGAPTFDGGVSIDTFTLSTSSFNWKFRSDSNSYTKFIWMALGN